MRKFIRNADAEEPLSLNSLLDTLMNVVGVSLILLAAADLSLIKTTKDLLSSHIPRDISKRLEAERLNHETTASPEVPAPPANDTEERKQLLARLQLMEALPARVQDLADRLGLSQRSLKALQDEGSELDSKIDALRLEIAKISGEEARAPKGTTIQLPIRRTVSKELQAVTVVCRNGRALILDYGELNRVFSDAMQISKARLSNSMTLAQQVRSVVSYFDTIDVGTQSFKLSLQPSVDAQQFRGFLLSILPRKTLGANADDISALRHLNPASQYVSFLVWEDSFQFYLSLRGDLEKYYSSEANGATRIGLSWTPYATDEEMNQLIEVGGSSSKPNGPVKKTTIDN